MNYTSYLFLIIAIHQGSCSVVGDANDAVILLSIITTGGEATDFIIIIITFSINIMVVIMSAHNIFIMVFGTVVSCYTLFLSQLSMRLSSPNKKTKQKQNKKKQKKNKIQRNGDLCVLWK